MITKLLIICGILLTILFHIGSDILIFAAGVAVGKASTQKAQS